MISLSFFLWFFILSFALFHISKIDVSISMKHNRIVKKSEKAAMKRRTMAQKYFHPLLSIISQNGMSNKDKKIVDKLKMRNTMNRSFDV